VPWNKELSVAKVHHAWILMFGFVDFRWSPVIRLFPSVADAHQTSAFRAWTMGEPYTTLPYLCAPPQTRSFVGDVCFFSAGSVACSAWGVWLVPREYAQFPTGYFYEAEWTRGSKDSIATIWSGYSRRRSAQYYVRENAMDSRGNTTPTHQEDARTVLSVRLYIQGDK